MAARKLVDFDGPPRPCPIRGGEHGGLRAVQGGADGRRARGGGASCSRSSSCAPIRLDRVEIDGVAPRRRDPDLDPVVRAAERVAHAGEHGDLQRLPERRDHRRHRGRARTRRAVLDAPSNYPRVIHSTASRCCRRRHRRARRPRARAPRLRGRVRLGRGRPPDPAPHRARRRLGPSCARPASRGVLLSTRGGDYELTVRQDLASATRTRRSSPSSSSRSSRSPSACSSAWRRRCASATRADAPNWSTATLRSAGRVRDGASPSARIADHVHPSSPSPMRRIVA